MLCIFISKDDKGNNFFHTVRSILEKYGSCCETNFFSSDISKDTKFLLSQIPFAKLYNGKISIVIVLNTKTDKTVTTPIDYEKNIIAIINENNTIGTEILKNVNCPVINYGLAENNTLSVSSLSDNRAFISLQRELTSINGHIIEPHDFPVILNKPISVYPLLASCAILLISEINSENGYIF